MAIPDPESPTYIIPADLKRTELPDGEWIVVRGMEDAVPRILFSYTALDGSIQETWLSLGETVEVLNHRTLRFENLAFGGTSAHWTVTIREVLPDTPPYQPASSDNQTWHPVELRPFGALDENTVVGLEQRIGTELPPSYREWLLANNGAAPTQDVTIGRFPFCLNEIHPLLGLRPDAPHLDLAFGESRRQPWLTDDYLVIAVPLGGLLAVKIRGVYADRIVLLPDGRMHYGYSYDQQEYTSPADFLSRTALLTVAPSIHSFCYNLQPLPPVPPGQIATLGPASPHPTW